MLDDMATNAKANLEVVSMAIKPIPDGYHTVTPYLLVSSVPKLIDFLKNAFNAEVSEYMDIPDGTVVHAQVKIGDSFVMMVNGTGKWGQVMAFRPDATRLASV